MFLRKNGLQRYYLNINFQRVIKNLFYHQHEPHSDHKEQTRLNAGKNSYISLVVSYQQVTSRRFSLEIRFSETYC
jgi:hypothetical protein